MPRLPYQSEHLEQRGGRCPYRQRVERALEFLGPVDAAYDLDSLGALGPLARFPYLKALALATYCFRWKKSWPARSVLLITTPQSQLLPHVPINTLPSSDTGCHHPSQCFPANTPVAPDIFQVPRSAPGSITHSSLKLPSFDLRAQTPTPRVLPSGVVMKYPPHFPAALLMELSLVVML